MENQKPIPNMYFPVPEQDMLQEHLRENPWAMMIGCILLNQTHLRQVNKVMPTLFSRWGTAKDMMEADEDELVHELKTLGLQNRRAHTLKTFSQDWLDWGGDIETLKKLYGVGEYAYNSWMIFQVGDLSVKPKDKELKKYLKGYDEKSNVIYGPSPLLSFLQAGHRDH